MKLKYKIVWVAGVSMFAFSCGNDKPVTENTTTNETVNTNTVVTKPRVIPPDFNADSAFAYIKTQQDVNQFNVKYGVNLVLPQNA